MRQSRVLRGGAPMRRAGRASVSVSRARFAAMAVVLVVCALASGAPVVSADGGAEGCANEARRAEQGATFLPDCRAYELVTPPGTDSDEPRAVYGGFKEPGLEGIEGAHASVEGERLAWDSEYVFPGSQSPGIDYLSTRGVDGWSSENVIPPQSVANGLLCPNIVGMVGWSSDLSKGVLADGWGEAMIGQGFEGEGLECGHDEPRLAAGEQEGFQNLFVRDSVTGGYQLVDVTPSGVRPPTPNSESYKTTQYYSSAFLAGSEDLSHVVFEDELGLTPNAPSGDDLYEWANGKVRLVSILPDGEVALGALAGATRNRQHENEYVPNSNPIPTNIANYRHAVSADGSRVFFEAEGDLYVREHAEQEQSLFGPKDECIEAEKACTTQVDASQASGRGGGGEFMIASTTGSEIFFLDDASSELTSNTVPGSGMNLYSYDLQTHALNDLTPMGEAGVLGVSGAGEEAQEGNANKGGPYVYFVAEGVLAVNATAGQYAVAGQPNLYVDHAGALRFIATLNSGSDSCDWASNKGCAGETLVTGDQARVSADGRYIGFPSVEPVTGYNNAGYTEVFLYDAATSELACASCDPSGVRPTAPAIIRYPAQPDTFGDQRSMYPQRNVSDNGQVFFETANQLLPEDTNGQRNVYEYKSGGLYSISSGKSSADSYFLDASVNGSNVFFATAQQLLPSDKDAAYDVYDARVGGGFPEAATPDTSCASNEACAGAATSPPMFSGQGSETFVGGGNLTPPNSTTASETTAEKLAAALKMCRAKHNRHKRSACEARTRKRYRVTAKAKKSAQGNRRKKS